MYDTLTSAEEHAIKATQHPPFGVNINSIRSTLIQMLEMFGRNNFFREYTVHSYDHINSMLCDLDWIIPAQTKTQLTDADWLLIVLSIYFHDLGLVITEEEYLNRDKSAFAVFCERRLFEGRDGKEYQTKVDQLGSDVAERFFYQEFVRTNHAARVRSWIEGRVIPELGYAKAQIAEMNKLLTSLDADFRSDLAIVCESHNLDDISNLKKYKMFRPYGNSEAETANVIYAVAILRTVDLLQITNQRAPSVAFRFINPTDPISQLEWIKQNAVKRICPRPAFDLDGNATDDVLPDTISVYAKFKDQNGYFGLTSYLRYAQSQITESFDVVQKANKQITKKYLFPWRQVDDSKVEADGFIPTPFQFKIDHERILDLLTGHTLYNDSSVAIREIVQNSIDAVRLQAHLSGSDSHDIGRIEVIWSPERRSLVVQDNGTGMSQEIIVNHLLRVGSSRYKSQKFLETYPQFHAISRFGIGILASFMVADDIEITTFCKESDVGRQISLRTVHGKYLVKLMGKDSKEYEAIGAHGTRVELRFRATTGPINVLQVIRNWFLFPRCKILVSIGVEAPVSVGFDSPSKALESFLNRGEFAGKKDKIEIVEQKVGYLTVAYMMLYNERFREKSMLTINAFLGPANDFGNLPAGICVEGVRVEGPVNLYQNGNSIFSVINCVGPDAPTTSVSRSALENNPSRIEFEQRLLGIYLSQIALEMERLEKVEGFSDSYAVAQFPYIAGSLSEGIRIDLGLSQYRKFPMFMIENKGERMVASTEQLLTWDFVNTVEGRSFDALTELLRDAGAMLTAKDVADKCNFRGSPFPEGPLLTSRLNSGVARNLFGSEFEISELRAYAVERRLDVKWGKRGADKKWIESPGEHILQSRLPKEFNLLQQYRQSRINRTGKLSAERVHVCKEEMICEGLSGHIGVIVGGEARILFGSAISKLIATLRANDDAQNVLSDIVFCDVLSRGLAVITGHLAKIEMERDLNEVLLRIDLDKEHTMAFRDALDKDSADLRFFDAYAWKRDSISSF